MAQSTGSDSLTFFLPLLLILVTELSTVARGIELTKSVEEKQSPMVIFPIFVLPFFVLRTLIIFIASSIVIQRLSVARKRKMENIVARVLSPYYKLLNHVLSLFTTRITVQSSGKIKFEAGVLEYDFDFRDNDEQDTPTESIDRKIQFIVGAQNLFPFYFMSESQDTDTQIKQAEKVRKYRSRTIEVMYAIESSLIPSLGRFIFIHLVNNVILLLSLVLSLNLLDGDIMIVAALITTLLWVILPIMEIDEYDDVLSNRNVMSLPIHSIFTIALALMIWLPETPNVKILGWNLTPYTSISQSTQIYGILVLSIISIWIFGSLLERELLTATSDKRQTAS